MDIQQKLERSKSQERIDFSKIGCKNVEDSLVRVESSAKISVEPIWTVHGDFEGRIYAAYIADHPEYDGVYVRPELLQRLQDAADALESKYQIVVRAGHRPLEVQMRVLRECAQDYKDEHPAASDDEVLEHARTFVSDPEISLPPHCCGAAVDIEVMDTATRRFVDFGGRVNLNEEISFLHFDGLTKEQKGNRILLLEAMLSAGFASTPFEWWHFSYGDQTWAWFYGEESCLYGLVEV